jgi:hypothetical protein
MVTSSKWQVSQTNILILPIFGKVRTTTNIPCILSICRLKDFLPASHKNNFLKLTHRTLLNFLKIVFRNFVSLGAARMVSWLNLHVGPKCQNWFSLCCVWAECVVHFFSANSAYINVLPLFEGTSVLAEQHAKTHFFSACSACVDHFLAYTQRA